MLYTSGLINISVLKRHNKSFRWWLWYKLSWFNSKKFKVMFLREINISCGLCKGSFGCPNKWLNHWYDEALKSKWSHLFKSVNHTDLPWVKWNQDPRDSTQNNEVILMWQQHKNPRLIWNKERHQMQAFMKETAKQAGPLCLPPPILHSHLRVSPQGGAQGPVCGAALRLGLGLLVPLLMSETFWLCS